MQGKIKIGDIVRHKEEKFNKIIVTSVSGNGIGTFSGVWVEHAVEENKGLKSNRFRYEMFERDIEPFEHRFKVGDIVRNSRFTHLKFMVTDVSDADRIFGAVCLQGISIAPYSRGLEYENLNTESFEICD